MIHMRVNVTIKSRSGKVVKNFDLSGPQNLDYVLLWIWRDLFLCMFAHKDRRERKKVPEMLKVIEDSMGWQALERLLYGGKRGRTICCVVCCHSF